MRVRKLVLHTLILSYCLSVLILESLSLCLEALSIGFKLFVFCFELIVFCYELFSLDLKHCCRLLIPEIVFCDFLFFSGFDCVSLFFLPKRSLSSCQRLIHILPSACMLTDGFILSLRYRSRDRFPDGSFLLRFHEI